MPRSVNLARRDLHILAAFDAVDLPSRIQMMRSETSSILKSWVAEMIVTPRSLFIWRSSSMIALPVLRSRLPVGSSARMMAGSLAKARAMATRCCWPPESCAGLVEHAVAELDALEDGGGLFLGVGVAHAGEDHRQHHVFQRRHHRDAG